MDRIKFKVKGVEFGGDGFVVIAGPCAIESYEQMSSTASAVKQSGAAILRGGAFKMRTSPDSFQGLGTNGIAIARRVKTELGMPMASEVSSESELEALNDHVDILQVGARSMHNYPLLKAIGKTDKPVILKRGMSATITEWLAAASYISAAGNEQVILCERGIRTFESVTRNTLDLSAVAYAKLHSPFPVIADPSHGTGRMDLVAPLSLAAAAVGADGLLIEVHRNPPEALCDKDQALNPQVFADMMTRLNGLLDHLGRPLARAQNFSG